MTANVLIKAMWIAALVVMALNGREWWAAACFIGALISGFNYRSGPR